MAGKVLNISLNATITPLQKALENVGKMMNDFAASIEKTDKKMADSIKASVAEMNSSLEKVKQSFVNTEKAGDNAGKKGTASLRQQLREATLEAQRLADAVGTSDPKFIAAATRAAKIKDEIGDTALAIDALNPDEKFKGLTNVIKGGVGGVQALTGAMAAFGGESEAAQETIKKLQSLMAITEGLNAIGGLADAMGAVKTQVIAAAQSMGTLKFAIAATGIGALVIAVGMLASNWDEVSLALSDASLKTEILADKQRKLAEEMDKAADQEGKSQDELFTKKTKYMVQAMDYKIREIEKQKELAQASGASASKIYQLDIQKLKLEEEKAIKLKQFASQSLSWHNLERKFGEDIIELKHQQTLKTTEYNTKLREQANELKKIQQENEKRNEVKMYQERMKAVDAYSKQELELKKQTGLTSLQIDAEFEAIRKSNKLLTDSEILQSISKRYEDEKKLREDDLKSQQDAQMQSAKMLQEVTQKAMEEYKVREDLAKKKGMTILQIDDQFEKLRLENAKLTNEQIYAIIDKANKDIADSMQLSKDASKALNDALKNLATDGIYMAAEAMGTALAGGAVSMESLFNNLVAMVADTAMQLGKTFIGMGISAAIVQSNVLANPPAAIAAGAALVALGAAAKQIVKNMGAPKKMEQGGIVYGNSFVNVGEYGNAHTNPEVIAPLSKLRDLIGNNGTQKVVVEGRIYGSQLALASNRNQSVIKRVTGRR